MEQRGDCAVIGRPLASPSRLGSGIIMAIINATIGAVILLVIVGLIKRA